VNGFAKSLPRSSASSPDGSWWTPLAKAVRQWTERKRLKRLNRRGIGELMAADDRLLADVGLRRGDVECAGRHGRLPAGTTGHDAGR